MSLFLGLGASRSSLPRVARCLTRCAEPTLAAAASVRPYTTCHARRRAAAAAHADRPGLDWRRTPRHGLVQQHARRWPAPGADASRRYLSLFDGGVVKHYVDLPPDYRDEDGLAFRRGDADLTQDEVLSVFGPGLAPRAANRLLRVLHGRRVAGTLDDPALRRHTARFREPQVRAALAYLRRAVPVDEVINAGLRAEDELRELEEAEAAARAREREERERDDAEAAAAAADEQEAEAAAAPGGERGVAVAAAPEVRPANEDIYGVGVFDKIRARNIALREEEERRLEEERRRREEEAAQNSGGLAPVDGAGRPRGLALPREVSPRMKKWQERGQSGLAEAPEMSKLARLAPSALFVAALVAGLALLAELYLPPRAEYRLLPDLAPSTATVLALVAANALVWAAWKVPPAWPLLNRYFILVPATPRPAAILGALFSHQKLSHLAVNMAFLWFFGTRLHDEAGRGAFLAVYLASGSLGFLATMANIVRRGAWHLSTLGASGAIYGVATAYFWLHRFEGFKVLGLPPDPYGGPQGLGFIGLLLSLNLAALLPGRDRHLLDVASHLGGMGAGLACAALLERRREARRRERAEPRAA